MTDQIQVTCQRCKKTMTVTAKSTYGLVSCTNPSCGMPIVSPPISGDWYYRNGSVVFGPLSSIALRMAAQNGKIDHETTVRKGENGNWVAAKHVRGLIGILEVQEDDDSQSLNEITERVETGFVQSGDNNHEVLQSADGLLNDEYQRCKNRLSNDEQVHLAFDELLVTNKRLIIRHKTYAMRSITSIERRKRRGDYHYHPLSGIVIFGGLGLLGIGLIGLLVVLSVNRDSTVSHSESSAFVCVGCGVAVFLFAGLLVLLWALFLEGHRDPTTFQMIITTAGGEKEVFMSDEMASAEQVARAVEEAMIAYE